MTRRTFPSPRWPLVEIVDMTKRERLRWLRSMPRIGGIPVLMTEKPSQDECYWCDRSNLALNTLPVIMYDMNGKMVMWFWMSICAECLVRNNEAFGPKALKKLKCEMPPWLEGALKCQHGATK